MVWIRVMGLERIVERRDVRKAINEILDYIRAITLDILPRNRRDERDGS